MPEELKVHVGTITEVTDGTDKNQNPIKKITVDGSVDGEASVWHYVVQYKQAHMFGNCVEGLPVKLYFLPSTFNNKPSRNLQDIEQQTEEEKREVVKVRNDRDESIQLQTCAKIVGNIVTAQILTGEKTVTPKDLAASAKALHRELFGKPSVEDL